MPLWLATTAGFWTNLVLNFVLVLQRTWTFPTQGGRAASQLTRYSALVAVNYVMTVTLVSGLHDLATPLLVAKVLSVGAITVSNFVIYRFWVFAGQERAVMVSRTCGVCGGSGRSRRADWCFQCRDCGTWSSTLPVGINADEYHAALDEGLREDGLAALRDHNLDLVAQRLLAQGVVPGSRVLDVGSAHGWFLRSAEGVGFEVLGVEPDEAVAAQSVTGPVRVGFFPDALDADERFDAITYNDVLEHLPDLDKAITASAAHLTADGVLSVNIPNRRGLFFRLALVCHVLGLKGAFERLWQVGLPSPHLWYVDASALERVCERHGLSLTSSSTLDSVRREGLWQRAHSDRRPSPTSIIGFAVVWLAAPIFNLRSASDISHLTFRKASTD